jgi:hypothetical protein
VELILWILPINPTKNPGPQLILRTHGPSIPPPRTVRQDIFALNTSNGEELDQKVLSTYVLREVIDEHTASSL